jgi:GR25 family glycosyltransferase involved in LPS biosynthesis
MHEQSKTLANSIFTDTIITDKKLDQGKNNKVTFDTNIQKDITIRRKTICLNMIVKNEAHVITQTFDNILSYFQLDYWVISDTGSTDGTQDVIKNYFASKKIKGQLHQDEWRDFGHNRTLALQYAKNKTDYLFIFDADDSIHGECNLPPYELFHKHMYNLKFGVGVSYVRPLLINNKLDWCFCGVLHEYLSCKSFNVEGAILEGDYYVESGRAGNRSQDPNKYKKDAEILKKAYYSELSKPSKGLSGRYAFYCGQSYKDCRMNRDAIEWYKLVADELQTWVQEKFYSCLSLGELYKRENDIENSIKYYTKSIIFDNERIEGIALACEILLDKNMYLLCCALGQKFLGRNTIPKNKLFLFEFAYYNHIDFSCSQAAHHCNEFQLGYDCCKHILLSKCIETDQKLFTTCTTLLHYTEQIKKDDKDGLHLFYSYNDIIQNSIQKNKYIPDEMHKCWNILFEKNRSVLTKLPTNVSTFFTNITNTDPVDNKSNHGKHKGKKNKSNANNTNIDVNNTNVTVFISFTTCKRYDLFKQTMGSILNHWTDANKIDYWFCVDDNSSSSDREMMKSTFPWINYYMKTEAEKGHRESMNIIWNKLNTIRPKYWIHMEDDFLFYTKRSYVSDAIKVLETYKSINVRQVLYNRNYAEVIEHTKILGHKDVPHNLVIPDLPIVLHNHNTTDTFGFGNCCYWPDYSFRPSMIDVDTILALGNYDTDNTFFEMDYAKKWHSAGYRSAFYSAICCMHIGRLTSERNDKSKPNSYELNNTEQFNSNSTANYSLVSNKEDNTPKKEDNIPKIEPVINKIDYAVIRKTYSPPIKINTKTNIKILNLKHRQDRKDDTTSVLSKAGFLPDQYEFVESINGNELTPTLELYAMFKDNDFSNRCGFIGCALTHYGLWLELLKDTDNDYYVIFEDDIELSNDFSSKLNNVTTNLKSGENGRFNDCDFLFLGYHMFEDVRTKWKHIYDVESDSTKIMRLDKEKFIGGTFAYVVTKRGAKNLIDYIINNGIKHGIDYLHKIVDSLIIYECQPLLTQSEWFQFHKPIDTSIQLCKNCLDFSKFTDIGDKKILIDLNSNDFIFIQGVDQMCYDLFQIHNTLENMKKCASEHRNCVAFNTLGFFKTDIVKLTPSPWFKENDGVYIKKKYLCELLNIKSNLSEYTHSTLIEMINERKSKDDHDNHIEYDTQVFCEIREKCDNSENINIQNTIVSKKIRIKMLCNWSSSYDLCKEWSVMCTDPTNYLWNNIEITWDNKNIDYYVIINMPRKDDYYNPKKTILFQMEPWVYDNEKNWGVKTWGQWANPDNEGFMKIFRHKKDLNNVQWQMKLPETIESDKKCDRIISILSRKNCDEGHKKRIEFVKYIENNLDDLSKLHIYGMENYHNLKSYVGKTDNKIEYSNYKYCFSCENNSEKNYATEKIWEPILFECLCFYWGCPNLDDYIDSSAFVRLPLDNFEESISIIKKAIEEDWWSKRIDVIRKEKEKILNKLGFFPRLQDFINTVQQ